MPASVARARAAISVAALGVVALLLLVPQGAAVSARADGLGIGILAVNGSLEANVTLASGGAYYLTVAPDASSYVNASLVYNGSVLASVNRTVGESSPVSLPAGNYSLALVGRGRVALGWDFTNGALQEFPDDQPLVAFLTPSGPSLQMTVALGDAQSIALRVYDDALAEVGNATATVSGPLAFTLPALSDSVAYLVATATAGNPNGRFGLSWSSVPANGSGGLTAWPGFLLWILVPVAVAFVIFALLQRARFRRGGMP